MNISERTRNPLYDLILLTLLLAMLFGLSLGNRLYSTPSESRYIEIGREMAESGDYVTPRLDYVKYFEKPPLFYWIQAGATKLWGIDFYASRVPTACFAILLCLITYGLGRMLYGRLAGWLGSLVLATSLYMFALSRVVLVDVPVSVFIVTTLTAFLYVANASLTRKRTFILYSMYAAAACAVLSKGLIGIILPGAVVFLWMALTKRWNLLKELRLVSGTLLFLLIAVPWHVLVAMRNPEFLHFYFIHEHFERYLTKVHGRYQPFWFFGVVLVAGIFPWLIFAWQAVKSGFADFWQSRFANGNQLFLLIWIVLIFVFFSLSDSKLIPYILPIFPPICVLMGRYFAAAWQEKPAPGFTLGIFAMLLLLILAAIAPALLMQVLDADSKVIITLRQAKDEANHLSVAAMIGAGLLLIVYIQGRAKHVVITLIIIAAFIIELGAQVSMYYNKDTMRVFAASIEQLNLPDYEIITYDNYYQDLPVYLKKRVTIANWKGELEFGAEHEDTSAWIIDDKEFWHRWLADKHIIFAIMRKETYNQIIKNKDPKALHLFAVREDDRNILLANQMERNIDKPE